MKRDTTLSLRVVAVVGAVAVGAATGATTGSVSASILLALAVLVAVILVVNIVTGRATPREALLTAGTGVLPPVVFFACTGLGLGGSSAFDTDSQLVGALAGGGILLLVLVLARPLFAKRGGRPKPHSRA